MEVDASEWSGDGTFTERLIEVFRTLPDVRFLKVGDAPASRADAGFSFISNELFVGFRTERRVVRVRRLGIIPWARAAEEKLLTLGGLETHLAEVADVGPPDYSDEGMLQYLRTERIVPPYQTRGYKLVELVRIYEAGTIPRRED
jgi:hypothetical protein